jgi:hypothetical protein
MSFVINNQTNDTVGPYNGQTIAANDTLTVDDPVYDYAADEALQSDALNGVVSISVGDEEFTYRTAYRLLVELLFITAPIGHAATSLATLVGGRDDSGDLQTLNITSFNELSIQFRNSFRNITGNGTTTVKSGAGRLHGISINNNYTNGTIAVYDNTAASGTLIGTFQVASPSGGLLSSSGIPSPVFVGPLGAEFSTGLTVVTAGSSNNNITVYYK